MPIKSILNVTPVASPESWPCGDAPGIDRLESIFRANMARRDADAKTHGEPRNAHEFYRGRLSNGTPHEMIKDRARAYALRPRHLDELVEGLSGLSPSRLVGTLQPVTIIMRTAAPLNIRAAMLFARWSRLVAHIVSGRAK